jgi:hypothetical protein
MLHSEIIDLRATTLEDLDFVLAVEGDEPNRRFIGQWSREQHTAALDDSDIMHLIVQDQAGERAGFKLEGTLRECVRTAEGFESLQIMSILHQEYSSF